MAVETLERIINVKIPAGVQTGDVLRIRGKGLPGFRSKRKGDFNIRVSVEIPRELASEERELYQRLRLIRQRPGEA